LATVLPIATTFSLDGPSRASWFVAGVERRLQLSPVRLDLLRLLAEPTTTAADGVVEFKAPAAIVHALRARGWHATRRSVIVEIARLRVALGHGGRELIETRRGLGYRFRVLQPRATDQPCA
jgi:DNA-binding response OmpR family regulator